VFGRRKKKDEASIEDSTEDDTELDGELDGEDPESAPAPVVRPQGPWDAEDAPEDDLNRIDLGGVRIPVPPDTEVRVDVDPAGQVIAATLLRGDSAMQINAFAAPRSAGIWAEIRAELTATLREGGARADEAEGRYGVELHATVPTPTPGQGPDLIAARFLGVDGPRWFLRGLVTGPAVSDPAEAAELEAAFQAVVVHRGTEAMAVRSPLPLRLPREVTEASTAAGAAEQPSAAEQEATPGETEQPSLELPERGPEITERR